MQCGRGYAVQYVVERVLAWSGGCPCYTVAYGPCGMQLWVACSPCTEWLEGLWPLVTQKLDSPGLKHAKPGS